MASSGMLHYVALVRTELGTRLAVTSNRRMLHVSVASYS
jgi:hypothetical protein